MTTLAESLLPQRPDQLTEEPFFCIDRPRLGEENMEIDRHWLHMAEQSSRPMTLFRFYQWARPTVSIGRNQQIATAVDRPYCVAREFPIVRRPTGGRAVLHASELTYAVVSTKGGLIPMERLERAYHFVAQGLLEGLARCGVPCNISPEKRPSELHPDSSFKLPCFSSTTRFEIVAEGRKIVGSAQRRLRKSFLQHGSIPLRIDYTEMAAALGSRPDFLREKMISVEEAVSAKPVTFKQLAAALESAFSELLPRK